MIIASLASSSNMDDSAPSTRLRRAHSSLGFAFEEDEEINVYRKKRSYSSLNGLEFEQFTVALGKLAEIDNLHVVDLNYKFPTNLTEFCSEVYRIFDGIHVNRFVNYASTGILMTLILLSFVISFAQTEPHLQTTPSTCVNPVCNNNPQLCPGVMICEPVADASLELVNDVIIYLFTVEYLSKLFTCWAMSPRDLGLVHFTHDVSIWGTVVLYANYFFAFKNLVDLLTILPYYVSLGRNSNTIATLFLRVFRFLKIIRIVKGITRFETAYRAVLIVIETMRNSSMALGVMFGFVVVAMVFFGSIIYAVEGGTFQVTEEYPLGAYLRRTINGQGSEVSPFNSIPTSFYWVIITCTTVGYGDLVPTSWVGRMIACILCLTGILVLALPIGIVGANFAELYVTYIRDGELKNNIKIDMMNERNMIELFKMIDVEETGAITIFQLKDAFDAGGVKLNEAKLTKVFAQADSGGDGNITQKDFLQFCKEIQGLIVHEPAGGDDDNEDEEEGMLTLLPPMDDTSMTNFFHLIDENQNGSIDKTELQHAFQRKGIRYDEKKPRKLFRSIASSEDAGIGLEEFKVIFGRFQGNNSESRVSHKERDATQENETISTVNNGRLNPATLRPSLPMPKAVAEAKDNIRSTASASAEATVAASAGVVIAATTVESTHVQYDPGEKHSESKNPIGLDVSRRNKALPSLLQRAAEVRAEQEQSRRDRLQLDEKIRQWDEEIRLLQEQSRAAKALRDQADRRIEEAWDERNEIDSQLAEMMMLVSGPPSTTVEN